MTKEQSPECFDILPTPIGLSSTQGQGQEWFIFVSRSDIGRKRGTESKFSLSGLDQLPGEATYHQRRDDPRKDQGEDLEGA